MKTSANSPSTSTREVFRGIQLLNRAWRFTKKGCSCNGTGSPQVQTQSFAHGKAMIFCHFRTINCFVFCYRVNIKSKLYPTSFKRTKSHVYLYPGQNQIAYRLPVCLPMQVRVNAWANFTATPTSGCSPLVVNFTDQSTGNPTQWRWDLGNGTISFYKTPRLLILRRELTISNWL